MNRVMLHLQGQPREERNDGFAQDKPSAPASEPELDRGLWLKRGGVGDFLGKVDSETPVPPLTISQPQAIASGSPGPHWSPSSPALADA